MFRRIFASKYSVLISVAAFVVGISVANLFNYTEEIGNGYPQMPEENIRIDATALLSEERNADEMFREATEFYVEFRRAVGTDDRKKVSSMMHYPVSINFYSDAEDSDPRLIKTQAEFLRDYDKIFHKSVKDYIKVVGANLPGNSNVGCSRDELVVAFTRPFGCAECTREFKVILLPSNIFYLKSLKDKTERSLKRNR